MMWPFRSAQARLDDKAAEWASRMQSPERERHREAFERWYQSKPTHAEAFDEAMASFEEAGILRQGDLARGRSLLELPKRAVRFRYAFGAAVAAALVALIFLASAYGPPPLPDRESFVRYATPTDETREIDLADGSRMILGRDSVAIVGFTRRDRRISLERGRGRFSVAHEARPFRVAAGDAEVLARGTLFDVILAAGRTRVTLIEGSVDVTYPASSRAERRFTRLSPGQQLVVGGRPQTGLSLARAAAFGQVSAPALASSGHSALAMLEFDDMPLAQALVEANRRSRTKILLADPEIGQLRVTGAFRAGDAQALAHALVAAFRLRLEQRHDGTLLLHANEPPAPRR